MPLKKGQKLTDNPLDVTVRARMNKEIVDKLDYLAEKENTTRSEIIRRGIEMQYENEKK